MSETETGAKVYTVTEVNQYITSLLDGNSLLSNISIRGEISNFKHHTSGHIYLSIKDKESVIKCVMFRASAAYLKFEPEDGMMVVARGRISVYKQGGQYQLYISSMEPDGIGALYIAYEKLKEKLRLEGLFDESRKKKIPSIPQSIGIVTSPTGAAIRDMVNVLSRRFPYAEIVLFPCLVQGAGAAEDIIKGIKYFNRQRPVSTIIIGRGGGSIEDLWAFNDEKLAYAIADSEVPVISAVGHETDFTISDFVADLRAPTPSAAAELAVPDTAELKQKIANILNIEGKYIINAVSSFRNRLEYISQNRAVTSPVTVLDQKREYIDVLADKGRMQFDRIRDSKKNGISVISAKLDALNPLKVISRGYGILHGPDGSVITDVDHVRPGDVTSLALAGGNIISEVREIQKIERQADQ